MRSHTTRQGDHRTRLAVRRLLDAVDRALAVAREVEAARTALDKAALGRRLRIMSDEGGRDHAR
jgi:hypothetical protein